VIRGAGLVDVELANPIDAFAGASGEASAREFGTLGASRLTRVIQAAVQQNGSRIRFNERGLLWQVNAFERIA
jgi:hypothetical protein